ncbi:MAG TPA: pyridoxal-phosphate dependent enzyme [Ktedonobacteraceae bacterium]|nr:pyridoxal-phosphate dependent enzyme [Ktedonobacteraceae bacterium]
MPRYISAPELTGSYVDKVWETLPRSIRPTFFLAAPALSARLGCELTIASETFQYTGSFKFRAAYNLLASVPQQRIVASSSGNFGQAVAYASQLLGKSSTIVMPATSARVKIAAVQGYGGVADLIDTTQISRAERVRQLLREQEGAFEAHAYDDYRVVVGNSTLGKEIFSAGTFDVLVVPVGGGGLSAGQVVARDHLNVRTEIIGAEPQPGNDAVRSLRAGQLVRNEQEPATVADGARTISLGNLNWEILRQGVADILEVPDAVTLEALRAYFAVNLKVEPTGALALGAVLAHPERFANKRVCCVVSGGNVDPLVYGKALLEE